MSASERQSATTYAGPGTTFPLYSSGAHLHAAWMLAGHAADPAAVRARIKSFADKHGLTHLLPASASADDADEAKKAQSDSKAARLLAMAFSHESMEGDDGEKHRLIDFAQTNGLSHALPDAAHGFMHEHGIPHGHPGDEQDGAPSLHAHPVQKAVNVVVKTITIEKAWDDGAQTIIEGWTSTEDQDAEKDVVPPECFAGALDEYMARKGPLSSEHDTRGYPVGHAQRVALVRDGQVFKSATHPTDAAEFEHFPAAGTGMYGRYVLTDPAAADAVRKGNVGGFSWIGNLTSYEPLPGGGRRFLTVYPLRENTVAAYPVNGKAVLTAVKSFEAELVAASQHTETEHPLMGKLEDLLEGAAKAVAAEEAAKKAAVAAVAPAPGISTADLAALFVEFEAKVLGAMDEKVAKALPAIERESGSGRVGTVTTSAEDPRDADPASYIVSKAREATGLSADDQDLAMGITRSIMLDGMID